MGATTVAPISYARVRCMSDSLYSVNDETSNNISVLSQLKEIVNKKVKRDEVFIEVPERNGVKILISPNITQNQLKAWQKTAGAETKNGIDATKFACLVLANTTTGVFLNNKEVLDDGGDSIGFASPVMLEMTGAGRAVEAVSAFFGLDPHVEAAALAVLDAAGYGDTIETIKENPTNQS